MTSLRHLILAVIVPLVIVIGPLGRPDAAASELTAAIQKQYDELTSFKAAFVQVLVNAATKEKDTREGHIYFSQPSLIRWETEAPEKELVVVGKNAVWNWFPADGMAIKYSTDEVLGSRTVIRFISGKANLSEDFLVVEHPGDDGLTRLELTPKEPDASLVQATIWVAPENAMIRRVEVMDFYGNVNRVELNDLTLNPKLAPDIFTFVPPADAEVQDNTTQGS